LALSCHHRYLQLKDIELACGYGLWLWLAVMAVFSLQLSMTLGCGLRLWLAVVACGCGLRLWLVAEAWLWPLIMAYGLARVSQLLGCLCSVGINNQAFLLGSNNLFTS